MHIKSTDRHQFLRYTSSHFDHTKRSIIYSQILRISRIRSKKTDFLEHLESMKSWFEVMLYPNKLIEQEVEKVKILKNCKRCKVCLNLNKISTFTTTVTGETYIINHKFNCKNKGLVNLYTCNCCKK